MKITKSYLKQVIKEELNKVQEMYGVASNPIATVKVDGEQYKIEYDGEEAASTGGIYIMSVEGSVSADDLKPEFLIALEQALKQELGSSEHD
jgi:hypothetical protein